MGTRRSSGCVWLGLSSPGHDSPITGRSRFAGNGYSSSVSNCRLSKSILLHQPEALRHGIGEHLLRSAARWAIVGRERGLRTRCVGRRVVGGKRQLPIRRDALRRHLPARASFAANTHAARTLLQGQCAPVAFVLEIELQAVERIGGFPIRHLRLGRHTRLLPARAQALADELARGVVGRELVQIGKIGSPSAARTSPGNRAWWRTAWGCPARRPDPLRGSNPFSTREFMELSEFTPRTLATPARVQGCR